jgi:serine/threonine protein phosphatase PrpC
MEVVTGHLQTQPLTQAELNSLGLSQADELRNEKCLIAYGATLLVVAVTDRFVSYLQLGDGEILTVSDKGEVTRPLNKDDRLFGNETTSLCAPEAWRDFRVNFQPLTHSHPALILLSTDGYPNSFRDESGFFKVGTDILRMIRENGIDTVRDNLEQWLADSTRAGSGDDVTLGIVYKS